MVGYKNLEVWQLSIRLAKICYELIKRLPTEERFALGDQMRRAVVSIPSNIAEGHSRHNDNEFLTFLRYAQGSRSELETQVVLCIEFGYFTQQDAEEVFTLLDQIGGKLNNLISAIKR